MSDNSTAIAGDDDSGGVSVDAHPFVQLKGFVNGSWFIFLIVAVASARLGGLSRYLGMPLITGYMLCGVCAGPFVLGMIREHHFADLTYVTQTALAFIAFSAGSELYLPELRSLFKPIAAITLTTAITSYLGCAFLIYALSSSSLMLWMAPYDSSCRMMISLIAGSIMVARSPASAIAVVRELNAHGKLTSTMLGTTVVGDVVVLVLFTLSSSLTLAVCSGNGFKGAEFLITMMTLVSAVGIGWALGYLFILLLWLPQAPWARWTILPLGLFVFILADWFEMWSARNLGVALAFDALLSCIVAGYVVTNQSRNRLAFMHLLSFFSELVFIPFFTKVGAELNLKVLYLSIGFSVIVALMRALCMALGGWSGGKIGGLSRDHCSTFWLTQLSQAGVSLGLASEVAVKFANSFGPDFQTAVVGVVVINQLCGPITCRYALLRAREDNKLDANGLPLDAEHGAHAAGEVDDSAPELELRYETEELGLDDIAGLELGRVPGSAAAGTNLHQRKSSVAATSGASGGPRSPRSAGFSTSPPPPVVAATLVNVHGARFRKQLRRAVLIGLDAPSLALAQRLLDSGNWQVVVIDESVERCASAEALLAARVKSQQAAVKAAASSSMFTPLSRGFNWLKRMPDALGPVLDKLLPQAPEEEHVRDSLMRASTKRPEEAKSSVGNGSSGNNGAKPRSPSHAGADGGGEGANADDDQENDPEADRHRGASSKGSGGGSGAHGRYGELKEEEEEDGVDEAGIGGVTRLHVDPSDDLRPPSPSVRQSPAAAAATTTAASLAPSPLGHYPLGPSSPAALFSSSSSSGLASSNLASRTLVHRLATEHARTFLEAYRGVEDDLFLQSDALDLVVIALRMDSVTWDLTRHLIDRRRMPAGRLFARVNHPSWAGVLASMGAVPLYSTSLESHVLSTLSTHEGASGASALFPGSVHSSLSDALASSIHAEDDLLCSLLEVSAHDRRELLRVHPPPPAALVDDALARSRQVQFATVVSAAGREDYMDAILQMHRTGASTAASANTAAAAAAAGFEADQSHGGGSTFVGGIAAMRHQQQQLKRQVTAERGAAAAASANAANAAAASSSASAAAAAAAATASLSSLNHTVPPLSSRASSHPAPRPRTQSAAFGDPDGSLEL